MNKLFSMSIRTQLLLIVLIVALPAAGIITYSGFKLRTQAIRDAQDETRHIAMDISSGQQNLTDAAEQLLVALAQLPDVQKADARRVQPVLNHILALNSRYSNLFIADAAGNIWASGVPGQSYNIADRLYFRKAMAAGQLASGEFLISPATGKAVLPLAYPYRNGRGQVVGVICLGFDLDYHKRLFRRFELPTGQGYLLLDHRGIVLSASGPARFVGTQYNRETFAKMQRGKDGDTVIETGMDGRERVITYRKLHLKTEAAPYMYVRTGVPLTNVLSTANRSLVYNLVLLFVGLLLALSFAWLIGRRSIADRVSLLEKATQQMARGDLNTTVSELVGGGELGRLGRTFDDMARQLAQRDHELFEYRNHLEQMVSLRTAEISALHDQLRESQKLEAVGLLAGGIAHDFRNILATIKGAVYLIQKRLDRNSPLMKYIDQVVSSIAKANNLSESLLAFSRKQDLAPQPLALNGVIRRTETLLRQIAGERVELTVRLTAEPSVIMADNNQLEQILLNMVTNARDAMPDGGSLTLQTENITMDDRFIRKNGFGVDGPYIVLSVADTGSGMADEVKEKVFEPFFTTKELGQGSGLGLAITYGIVKQYKGYIGIESAPQQGTVFRIYLPASDVSTTDSAPAQPCTAAEGTETLLLAEDDHDTRRTMAEVLRLTGYCVLEAGDGEEAVAVYEQNRNCIDLVFLDVWMPKKNGLEVYRHIKALNSATSFLFMSGYADDPIDLQDVAAEDLAFISKGALPEEILGKIRKLLDQQSF